MLNEPHLPLPQPVGICIIPSSPLQLVPLLQPTLPLHLLYHQHHPLTLRHSLYMTMIVSDMPCLLRFTPGVVSQVSLWIAPFVMSKYVIGLIGESEFLTVAPALRNSIISPVLYRPNSKRTLCDIWPSPRDPKCIHDVILHYGNRCSSRQLFFLSYHQQAVQQHNTWNFTQLPSPQPLWYRRNGELPWLIGEGYGLGSCPAPSAESMCKMRD
jgi:hypothetical protein